MRHQHHRLESTRLPGPRQGQVVPHVARVDLPLVHGAGVHVCRLLQEFQFLGGQCEGKAAQNERVKKCNDCKYKAPANPTRPKLVVIRLKIVKSPEEQRIQVTLPLPRTPPSPPHYPSQQGRTGYQYQDTDLEYP